MPFLRSLSVQLCAITGYCTWLSGSIWGRNTKDKQRPQMHPAQTCTQRKLIHTYTITCWFSLPCSHFIQWQAKGFKVNAWKTLRNKHWKETRVCDYIQSSLYETHAWTLHIIIGATSTAWYLCVILAMINAVITFFFVSSALCYASTPS